MCCYKVCRKTCRCRYERTRRSRPVHQHASYDTWTDCRPTSRKCPTMTCKVLSSISCRHRHCYNTQQSNITDVYYGPIKGPFEKYVTLFQDFLTIFPPLSVQHHASYDTWTDCRPTSSRKCPSLTCKVLSSIARPQRHCCNTQQSNITLSHTCILVRG